MSKFPLFISLTFIVSSTFASDTTRFKRHEFGVNTTLLIKQVLSFSNNNIPFSPYLATYRYHFKNNLNLRAGLGLLASKTSTTQDDINKRISKSYNTDCRLGIEKQAKLGRRWKAYYGFDITYTYNETSTESFSSVFMEQVKGFGGGPVCGIHFYITRNISLFAESALYYSDINDRLKITSTSPFGQNTTQHSNTIKGELFLPTTLYLSFRL